MIDAYNPQTIGEVDTLAIIARVDRYLRRHGSPYGECPVPGGDFEEARAVILADWQGADWESLEWTYMQRNGRPLFSPDLSDIGRHLRAVLFMAGRARRRGWVESGPMRRTARAETRRRDFDDSRGAGMASRAADPALIVEAMDSVPSQGIRVTAIDDCGKRLRWIKTRNRTGYTVEVVRREEDRTVIDIRPYTVYRFRRIGKVPLRVEDNAHYRPVFGIGRVVRSRPNPAIGKTHKRIPEGWTADRLREAMTGR